MNKRRPQDSDYLMDAEDDPIGLTSAFAPVKGPQSVEYDEGDDAIGLTGAFAPIRDDEDESKTWDEAGKWDGFDWDAPLEGDYAGDEDGRKGEAEEQVEAVAEEAGVLGEQEASGDGAAEEASGEAAFGKPAESAAESKPKPEKPADAAPKGIHRGRHAAPSPEMSPRMQQARKSRRTLITVIVILVIAAAVLGYMMFRTFSTSQIEADQQAQEQTQNAEDNKIGDNLSDGSGATPAKLTEVPNLTSLLGMGSDDAIGAIGHGATVTNNQKVDDEKSAIKTNLAVALTTEPSNSKTGTPTVYLGLDSDDNIIQVGYSASADALGFGSLSFSDAVDNEHVIEKTLAKIGVDVEEGSAKLPEGKDEYSTYDAKGNVTRERCSFEGDIDIDGTPCTWSAVLSYDYTTQLVTGDLSDTVRIIYVYLTEKS